MKKFILKPLLAIALLLSCQSVCSQENQPGATNGKPAMLRVYMTSSSSEQRLAPIGDYAFGPGEQPLESEVSVFINPARRFQSFLGIGGAITDASAEVFAALPEEKRAELLRAYYDPQHGIGYSLARTTIHSADFSSGSYTYIEEGDASLETFSIEHDRAYRIPLIKKAIQTAGGELLLYASPWSPPAFMKDNNNMLQGGKLLPQYRAAWALYYTKFIKAYEAEGIPVWGITIQNEPMALQRWESAIWTAEEERDFLRDHLGPTMEKEGLGDKNIIVWDHNRDLISRRANIIFEDPEAAKYAWGIGFHWYETWAGGETMHENLRNVAQSYPDKKLIFTEGTNESFSAERYQHWPNAERYGRSMINDFNAGTVGWTDWNILLDQTGGPNHVGNFCFAPIHGDTDTGELIYTPTYFYIGHFSKFIRPGAQRISATSSRSHLLTTAFINPDNSIAAVVMNQSDLDIEYNFMVGSEEVELAIPAHSMQTMVFQAF